MLSTVLIVLTLGAGDPAPHVAFSATPDAAACAAKAEAVTRILTAAGHAIVAQRCIATGQRVTPYDHAATAFPHRWRITLPVDPSGGGRIEPLGRLDPCQPAPDADPAVWCAQSAQGPAD